MSCSICNGYANCPCCSDEVVCQKCGSYDLEVTDFGRYKYINWHNYTCNYCGKDIINEPDCDW